MSSLNLRFYVGTIRYSIERSVYIITIIILWQGGTEPWWREPIDNAKTRDCRDGWQAILTSAARMLYDRNRCGKSKRNCMIASSSPAARSSSTATIKTFIKLSPSQLLRCHHFPSRARFAPSEPRVLWMLLDSFAIANHQPSNVAKAIKRHCAQSFVISRFPAKFLWNTFYLKGRKVRTWGSWGHSSTYPRQWKSNGGTNFNSHSLTHSHYFGYAATP